MFCVLQLAPLLFLPLLPPDDHRPSGGHLDAGTPFPTLLYVALLYLVYRPCMTCAALALLACTLLCNAGAGQYCLLSTVRALVFAGAAGGGSNSNNSSISDLTDGGGAAAELPATCGV